MEYNGDIWSQYPKDDKYYIDPLYVPYQKTPIKTECGVCPYNGWKKPGNPLATNPALERRGWGMDFVKMHPDKDHQCPYGWTPAEDGWCVSAEPEYEGTLYSDKAFVARWQYWDSYAPRLKDPSKRQTNSFDQRSVNPFTGNYVIYHNSKPNALRGKYGHLPARDSYLA